MAAAPAPETVMGGRTAHMGGRIADPPNTDLDCDAPPPPLPPFELERFFARHEFSARHLACCSDCQPMTMAQVLALADDEVRAMWDGLGLGYTETPGLPLLRAEISRQYPMLCPDDVTVLAPEEGVYLAMRALLSSGDRVVVTYPGYQSLYAVAKSIGCRVDMWEPVPCEGSAAGLRFRVADLARMLAAAEAGGPRTRVRLVVVNFPHNPTGCLPSRCEWDELVAAVARHDAYLFSDEMYRGLELAGEGDRLPSAADAYERGIALCGVSKTFGLPGLRIGWLASRAYIGRYGGGGGDDSDMRLQDRIRELKDYTTICSSAPSEVLALAALRASPAIVAGHLSTIRSNVDAFCAFVARFPRLLAWEPPAAGSVAFPRLLRGPGVAAFCERAVAEAGVLLLPASVYGHEASVARGHFRVGLGRKDLPECLEALGTWLEAHQATFLEQQAEHGSEQKCRPRK